MRNRQLAGIVVALTLAVGARPAAAQTPVPCNASPNSALGLAIANAGPGAVLAITGICQQSVQIGAAQASGVTITNETGNPGADLIAGDGIQGQLTILGPVMVFLNGIKLEGTVTDTGLTSTLLVQAGASALITNSEIVDGQRIGLSLDRNAAATVLNTLIANNGIANVAGQGDGIRVASASSLTLGAQNDDGSVSTGFVVEVSGNKGNGISAHAGSTVTVYGGAIADNGADEILLTGTSGLHLFGAQVTQSQPSSIAGGGAIQALRGANLLLAQGTSVTAGSSGGAVQAAGAAAVMMMGSTVSNATTAAPALQATGSASVILSGGNSITNSAPGGTAVEVSHGSSLMQQRNAGILPHMAGAPVTATQTPDTVTGTGTVAEQSTIELGVGILGGMPSLAWNGTLAASQNSSVRLSGGTAITGTLQFAQESNGFFNKTNGGTNVVGSVVCVWGGAPSVHIAAPANISPAPVLAASIAAATPNQCLPF